MILPKTRPNGRVALLGGSFDPPHLSHQLLAFSILAIEPIDELWVLPCADHPFGKKLTPFAHRMAMCELAMSRLSNGIHIVDIEQRLPKPNYTVRTLNAIHEERPDLKLSLVMGSDILAQLPKWHEPNRLEELAQLIIFVRQGFPIDALPIELKNPHVHEGYILPDIQSTLIREALKKPKSPCIPLPFIDQKVAKYILDVGLYLNPR